MEPTILIIILAIIVIVTCIMLFIIQEMITPDFGLTTDNPSNIALARRYTHIRLVRNRNRSPL